MSELRGSIPVMSRKDWQCLFSLSILVFLLPSYFIRFPRVDVEYWNEEIHPKQDGQVRAQRLEQVRRPLACESLLPPTNLVQHHKS